MFWKSSLLGVALDVVFMLEHGTFFDCQPVVLHFKVHVGLIVDVTLLEVRE